MNRRTSLAAVATVFSILLSMVFAASAPAASSAAADVKPAAAAATQPAKMGSVTGTVTFTQDGNDVKVVADLTGLPPSGKHGFHIHEKGDLSAPDLSSAGPHYNPAHESHGGPASEHHHAGDLGNLDADANGHAHLETTLKGVTVDSLAGRSVIIHAGEDDLKSNPAGNSGARIAGGKIEPK